MYVSNVFIYIYIYYYYFNKAAVLMYNNIIFVIQLKSKDDRKF